MAQEIANRATDRNINQGGERVFGEAKFAERTSELPRDAEGDKQRDGEQTERQIDDKERGDLIPKQQLIPPREFIERHSKDMTRDEYIARLGTTDNPDRTPPERRTPERNLEGRSRSTPGYDR